MTTILHSGVSAKCNRPYLKSSGWREHYKERKSLRDDWHISNGVKHISSHKYSEWS